LQLVQGALMFGRYGSQICHSDVMLIDGIDVTWITFFGSAFPFRNKQASTKTRKYGLCCYRRGRVQMDR